MQEGQVQIKEGQLPPKTTLDIAIENCQNQIRSHRFYGNITLSIAVFFFVTCAYLKSFYASSNEERFVLYAIFILIFGVLISLYRFHLKEISKYEHFNIGFHRIRIAATNSKAEFDTEVRIALTDQAFVLEVKSGVFTKDKKIESPIAGYPSSDAMTFLFNKLLEKFPDAKTVAGR